MYLFYLGWPFYIFIFILGLSLGSFLNSWMWRRRENINIINTRSICPACRRQLRWYENVPIISYICLHGRCRTCHRKIAWHYTFIEFFTAALLVFIAWYHVNDTNLNPALFMRDVFFITVLIVIFTYDALYKIILSPVVWTGAVVGLVFNYFVLDYSLGNLLLGAIAGGGFFMAQYAVSKGRWIGGGDVRMGVMMGLWLGWPSIIVAVFIAYILGAIVAVALLLGKKKGWSSEVPFGSFLALGTLYAMYHGVSVVRWYLSLMK